MKPGQLFDLPASIYLPPGHIGVVKDNNGKPAAKYEVVLIDKELKAKILVTYGNKRRKHESLNNGR